MGQRISEDAGNKVLAPLAEFNGAIDIAAFHALEHLLDDFRLAGGVLTNKENNALDDDSETNERDDQNGPHDDTTVVEELHGSLVHQEGEGQAASSDHDVISLGI
jgi:hypothetical protein